MFTPRLGRALAVAILLEIASSPVPAAEVVWDAGGTSSNASEGANWVGDVAPVDGDSVRFDTTSVESCDWNLSIAIASFTMAATNGQVLLRSSSTIGELRISSGTFQPKTGSTTTVTGLMWVAARGHVQWDGGRVRVRGGLRIDSPTCCSFGSPPTAVLEFDGPDYQVVVGTGRIQLPHVQVNVSSETAFAAVSDVEAKSVSIASGTLRMGGAGRLHAGGWTQTGGQFAAGASLITFKQNFPIAAVDVQPLAGQPFKDVEIGFGADAIAYVRALAGLEVAGSVTLTTGAFDGGAFTHEVGGDWLEPGGPSMMTGTLRLTGPAPRSLQFFPTSRLGTLEAVTPSTVTVVAGSTVTVSTLTLGSPALAPRLVLKSSSASPWYLNVSATATVSRTQVSGSNAAGGLAVRADLGDNLDAGGNVNWIFPVLSTGPLVALSSSAVTASWGSSFPPGTLYYAQISTNASFAEPLASSNTMNLSAAFAGLNANTTYYAQVATAPAGPFTALGGTVTWVQAPASVYFDEVTTHSIVASAYAPTPAFTGLNLGLSGTNVAKDGVYAGWHGESWTAKASLSTARYALSITPLNGRLYAVGGYNATIRSANEEYDPLANAWTAKTSMPVPLLTHTAVPAGGDIILSGGDAAGGVSNFHGSYSPSANAWTTLASLTAARTAHGAGLVGGRVYLFGGVTTALTASNQSYSLSAGTWSAQAAMPQPIQLGGFGVVRDRIYALGGYTTDYPASTVEFDPQANAWASKAGILTPRASFPAAALGGKLYAFGGQNSTSSVLAVNEEFDPAADSWAARLPLPTPRVRAGAAALGGRIYVVGGISGVALGTNEVYDPGVAQQFVGLLPNTQYTFKAKARNLAGVETAETADVSTYTLAAVPTGATPTFTGAFLSSVTLAWTANGNPGGTEYRVHASTASDFNAAASSVSTSWTTSLSTAVGALSEGTTYYFRVQARNAVGVETAFNGLGSTLTLRAQAVRVWDGGGATNLASEAANWVGDTAPQSGDSVRFDATNAAKFCNWNLGAVELSSFTMAVGFSTSVVLSSAPTIANDFTVAAGTLTGGGLILKGDLSQTGGFMYFNLINVPTLRFVGSAPQTLAMAAGSRLGILYIAAGSTVTAASSLTIQSLTYVEGADYRGLRGTLRLGSGFSHTITDQISSAQNFGDLEPGSVLELGGSTLTLRMGNIPQFDVRGTVRMDGGDGVLRLVQDGPEETWCNLWLNGPSARLVTDSAQDVVVSSPGMITIERGARLDVAGLTLEDVSLVFATSFSTHIVSASGLRFVNQSPGRGYAAFAFESNGLQGAATFLDSFFDVSVTTNVDASPLAVGIATITFIDPSGPKAGPVYENDPNNIVHWPALNTAPFAGVFASTLTAAWGSSYLSGTVYYVQISTNASFAAPVTSSNTFALSATFSGLTPNTTYYAQVATAPAGPFLSLGSTVTWVQAPTSVYFDEITTHSIVASAYAPTPAFSNLNVGLSGTNVARDGLYAGWHGESWTAKAVMTTARYGLSLAALNGRLYAMGGYNATIQSLNEEYNPASDAWASKAALPIPLLTQTAVPVEDVLLVSGGDESGGPSSFHRSYSPSSDAWTTLASLPAARTGHGAGVLGGKVHVIAGQVGSITADNIAYDPAANAWLARASLPLITQAHGYAATGGRLYALGGYTTVYLSTAVEYRPDTDAWTAKAAMPTPRAWFNAAAIGGKVYAFGGQNSTSSALALNEEYDPAADSWATRLALPTARTRPGVAALGGRIHVTGGIDGTPKSAHEVYDPGVAQQFAGLLPNTQYTFKAKARNLAGVETAETASFSTYTLAAAPAAPAFSGVWESSLTFEWTGGGNPGGTEFQAEVSASTSFAAPVLVGWSPDVLSALVTGLSPGTTYYARVRARNAVGVPSGYTTAASTRTRYATPAGCVVTRDVGKSAAPYGTITAALAAVPASLTAETCVVVRDTATYAEQVTVSSRTTNGFRLRILGDPALGSGATVAPPALSTAAFRIQSASVSLEGLRVAPGFPVMYGVEISTLYARLDRVLILSTVAFGSAAVGLDSFGLVENSTVSVGASRGVWSSVPTQVENTVRGSSVTNASSSLHAVWLVGRRNSLIGSFARNSSGTAVALGIEGRLEGSTATSVGTSVVITAANASSVTIARSMIESPAATFGLIVNGGAGHSISETTVTVSGAALSLTGVTRSTLSRVHVYSSGGTGLQMTSGSAWNVIALSTVVTGAPAGYVALSVNSSSNSLIFGSVVRSPDSGGLYLYDSQGISVVASTLSGRGSLGAAYFYSASQNALTDGYIHSPTDSAVELRFGSNGNTIQRSRLVSGAAAGYALYLTSSSANVVTDSLIENTTGYAAFFAVNANANTIDLSTVTARQSGYSALYLDNASTNTFTRSYFANLAGNGVTFGAGASSNTLSLSTVASSGAAARALSLFMASDSYVYDSWLLAAGYGAYADLSSRALILRSTVAGLGAVPGFMVAGSSGVVLRDSYTQGADAVNVYSSTGTSIERSTLKATGGSGKALQFLQGSNGLSLASATLSAAAVGLLIEDGSRGPLALTSFSVTASTGLQFTGGTQVATVSLAGFLLGTAVNVDASGLSAASRVTMRDAAGGRAGTLYETDPLGLVDWVPDENPVLLPGPFSAVSSNSLTASWTSGHPAGTLYYARTSTDPAFAGTVFSSDTFSLSASFGGLGTLTTYYARVATSAAGPFTALGSTRTGFGDLQGCATSKFVQKSGGADCASLGACVALVPSTPLTGDYCIAVLDSAVYSEQVTVAGKSPNGFRIRLWGAGGARPTVTPPAGSSAGFRLLTASVSVSDINVVTTNTVTYGVLASSASVSLSSMIVDSGGRINGAGVFLSSWGAVANASVTVQNADGFRLTGTGNTISASSASVTVFGRAAYYLGTASSNTISDSYGSGNPGYGAFVYRSHGNTFARTTLRKLSATAGAAGLYLNDASSNTVTGCFISNAGGPGADLSSSINYNVIELSTVTAAGSVYTALELGFGRGNRISRVYAHSAAGNAFTLSSAMSESLVEDSTFYTQFAGAAALSTNGSSETLTGNMLYAPNGIALALNGSSITVSRTSGFTATPSYSAFYIGSGGLVTVRDSSFENSAGDGGRIERASYVDILRSTMSGAGGGVGLKLQGASSNTVTASRIAAPGGVGLAVGSYLELFDMTTTTGSGNVFRDLSVSGSTAVSLGAAPGLALSSSVLTGDAQGAAIAFGDAVLVATFTGLAFPSGAALSADAALLPLGSRITIRDASGPQGGSLYERDPLSLVDWVPDLVPFVLPPAPAAPAGTVLGASSIAWTWSAVANAQSYRVYSSSSGSLLAASASTGVVLTGLLPATTNAVVVAGVARGENGPLSPSATAHTHASPPAGLALDFLFVSSAALSWSLEDNPWETLAELQRSTDGASYAVRAGTLAPNAVDSGLLGCTSYYYRVRHKSPAGVGSPFDGPVLVRTAASTPAAPGDLSAQSVPGRRVSLTWTGSATEGVLEYRLFKDTGAGRVDYSTPYAVFGPSVRSTTTVSLSTGAIHLFGLRAFHRCGVQEPNTHAVASAWALETLDGVRASIKVPATGKKISGNRVLVMAELDTGSSSDVSSILFQYRSTGSATWTDIPAANVNHPNPDREQPFFVHWDVSLVADRAYDLRAVASDVVGASDPAPGTVTVLVDSVGFEVKETDLGGGKVKKEQAVSNETSNTIATAESGSAVVTKVILPAGALNTADATLSATANPPALPPPPAAATSLGASIEITLSNGQSQLSNGQTAAIVFNYPDDNGDGVIDGTSVRAENAEIQTFDVPANKWKKEFATVVDKDKKTLTGLTPHFSLFAAFGVVTAGLDQIRVYPNPYKPNAGNPDEGRTFSRADPLSGVVFDNLPAVVEIKIYTLAGRLVSSFGTSAGTGAVQWDGKNDRGEDVASGGYFAVITSPGQKTVIKKLAVIR